MKLYLSDFINITGEDTPVILQEIVRDEVILYGPNDEFLEVIPLANYKLAVEKAVKRTRKYAPRKNKPTLYNPNYQTRDGNARGFYQDEIDDQLETLQKEGWLQAIRRDRGFSSGDSDS